MPDSGSNGTKAARRRRPDEPWIRHQAHRSMSQVFSRTIADEVTYPDLPDSGPRKNMLRERDLIPARLYVVPAFTQPSSGVRLMHSGCVVEHRALVPQDGTRVRTARPASIPGGRPRPILALLLTPDARPRSERATTRPPGWARARAQQVGRFRQHPNRWKMPRSVAAQRLSRGAASGIRTPDLRITSALLYP